MNKDWGALCLFLCCFCLFVLTFKKRAQMKVQIPFCNFGFSNASSCKNPPGGCLHLSPRRWQKSPDDGKFQSSQAIILLGDWLGFKQWRQIRELLKYDKNDQNLTDLQPRLFMLSLNLCLLVMHIVICYGLISRHKMSLAEAKRKVSYNASAGRKGGCKRLGCLSGRSWIRTDGVTVPVFRLELRLQDWFLKMRS